MHLLVILKKKNDTAKYQYQMLIIISKSKILSVKNPD